jgi:glycosyltransferase involved in cell wall biosynthesis
MKKPLVTIAVPTYNRANMFLKDVLDGALHQTYEHIEVLVSDNCSTDHTAELVQTYSDPRLKYIRQKENIGAFNNMQYLVEQAKGDYFLMHHDDDKIDRDFVQACMEAAGFRDDYGLIVTGSRVIDKDGVVLREKENLAGGLSFEDFVMFWFEKKIHLFLCSSLFGMNALREAGGFELKYNTYIDLAAQIKCASKGRADVQSVKASFREHPGSYTSATQLEEWCEDSLSLIDLACRLAPSKKKELLSKGMATSADRCYRYASEAPSKMDQLKGYWKVFSHFRYRQLPSLQYSNKLFPLSGYVLHPRTSLSILKSRIT